MPVRRDYGEQYRIDVSTLSRSSQWVTARRNLLRWLHFCNIRDTT